MRGARRFSGLARISCAYVLAGLLATGCVQSLPPTGASTKQRRETVRMQLTSPAVASAPGAPTSAAALPARFAMRAVSGGQNISIPYDWRDAPSGTLSFALTLVDTSPVAHDWVHWAVVDISASATGLAEGASGTGAIPVGSAELANSFGLKGYGGPQPPPGTGAHPYVATLYALDVARVDAPKAASAAQLESMLGRHALARATFTAFFGR